MGRQLQVPQGGGHVRLQEDERRHRAKPHRLLGHRAGHLQPAGRLEVGRGGRVAQGVVRLLLQRPHHPGRVAQLVGGPGERQRGGVLARHQDLDGVPEDLPVGERAALLVAGQDHRIQEGVRRGSRRGLELGPRPLQQPAQEHEDVGHRRLQPALGRELHQPPQRHGREQPARDAGEDVLQPALQDVALGLERVQVVAEGELGGDVDREPLEVLLQVDGAPRLGRGAPAAPEPLGHAAQRGVEAAQVSGGEGLDGQPPQRAPLDALGREHPVDAQLPEHRLDGADPPVDGRPLAQPALDQDRVAQHHHVVRAEVHLVGRAVAFGPALHGGVEPLQVEHGARSDDGQPPRAGQLRHPAQPGGRGGGRGQGAGPGQELAIAHLHRAGPQALGAAPPAPGGGVEAPAVVAADQLVAGDLALPEQRPLVRAAPLVRPEAGADPHHHQLLAAGLGRERPRPAQLLHPAERHPGLGLVHARHDRPPPGIWRGRAGSASAWRVPRGAGGANDR